MPITGEIQGLYKDREQTQPVFPLTKVKAISDDDGVGLNVLLNELATKEYVSDQLDNFAVNVDADTLGGRPAADYATQNFVTSKIAEAQLDGGDVDLSGYATKDNLAEIAATIPQIDATLAVTGHAADAKAVGEAINSIEIPVLDNTLSVEGAAADAKATGDAIDAINLKDLAARGTSNGDFDTIFEVGTHWMQLANCTNGPAEAGYGFLNVYNSSKTGTIVIQEFTMYANAGASWTRTYVNSAWTHWYSRALQSYPVGSIYMSTSSTSPASFIGGTWEQIKDKFLLAAGDTYSAGATGGAATVTLTTAQMPKHRHTSNTNLVNAAGAGTSAAAASGTSCGFAYGTAYSGSYVGSGESHNNMPPYLTVYIWQRIS